MTYDFIAIRDRGFRDLLPIIPPGATVSSYSKSLQGREDMLGKTPGKKVSDGWVGLAGWQNMDTPFTDTLKEWAESGAGVGLRCHDVVAVDIDVTDEGLARIVRGMAYQELGIAPCRTGNHPKVLLLYRLSEPGDWPTKHKVTLPDGHAIEILGSRQQFVLAGVHPKTGREYSWDCGLDALCMGDLPVVTPDDILDFIQETRELLDAIGFDTELEGTQGRATSRESVSTKDTSFLREVVAAIPNLENTTREEFVAMAHAVHGATEGSAEGCDIFLEWADRWPPGQADSEPERVYHSATDTTLGIQYLLDKARGHGFSCAMEEFGDLSEPDPDTEETNPEAPSLWDRWVYVNRLKRFVDVTSGAELDKENFDDLYVELADERPSKFFISHRRPGCFADDVDYQPGREEKVYFDLRRKRVVFNRWRPGPAENGEWDLTSTAGLDPWLQLGEHLFPNQVERDTLLNWMASLIQRPGQKPNWHPLVGSLVHGTGKDSFFAPLVQGLGDNAVTIRMGEIEGQWTWWAENVQLVVVSEVNSFERRAVMNRLKSYMASPPDTIEINKKGVQQYEVPNVFGMLMFTNNEDAVAIEHSDRRFYVVWSHAGALGADFYTRYHEWLRQGGAAAVYQYLLERDLTGFDTLGNAPSTKAKDSMRQAALGPIEGALSYSIEQEEGPFAADLFTMTDAERWVRGHAKNGLSPHKLALHLRNVGCSRLHRVRLPDDGRQTLWACRRHDTYESMSPAGLRGVYLRMSAESGNDSALEDFNDDRGSQQ